MRTASRIGPRPPGTLAPDGRATDSSARGPRSLGELFAADAALGALARAAGSRVDLAERVRASLAPELAGAVTACNLRPDGTLVVSTAGPEWAARLRFEAEAILTGCRTGWPAAARVRFRVGAG